MLSLENKVKKGFVTLAAAVVLSPVVDTIIPRESSGGLYAQQSSFFSEYSKKSNKKADIQTQKASYALQPVDFDILLNGCVYDSYRDVTFKQIKDKGFSINIPEGGIIRIVDPQKAGKYVEDIIVYTENGDKLFDNRGKSAFSDETDTQKLGLKSGDKGHLTFNLEFGLDIPSSMKIPYEIVPAPQPEPQPKPTPIRPQPRQRESPVPEAPETPEFSIPIEDQFQPSSPEIVYVQPYPVARPSGGFGLFFGFSSVRRYPVMLPGPMMGYGCMPYIPPMNYCPPINNCAPMMNNYWGNNCGPENYWGPNTHNNNIIHRQQGSQRNQVIRRSSLSQGAPRIRQGTQVTRSNLQQPSARRISPSSLRRR